MRSGSFGLSFLRHFPPPGLSPSRSRSLFFCPFLVRPLSFLSLHHLLHPNPSEPRIGARGRRRIRRAFCRASLFLSPCQDHVTTVATNTKKTVTFSFDTLLFSTPTHFRLHFSLCLFLHSVQLGSYFSSRSFSQSTWLITEKGRDTHD
jgi:hypothetical protein